MSPHSAIARRLTTGLAAGALLLTAACSTTSTAPQQSAGGSAGPGCPGEVTTIRLAGPNQWTDSGSSFGPAWEDLVNRFQQAEPCVKLETTVLPLDSFYQTISTQLAAGSAPDLVMAAVTRDPHMVHPLTDALNKPNPYIEGNTKWLDAFLPEYFNRDKVANDKGDIDFIPFNLVGVALFFNQDAFTKAGVAGAPKTFAELMDACGKLKAAGYTPMAMDNSALGLGWATASISAGLVANHADAWNVYDAAGKPGKADPLAAKSLTRALATGAFNASLPEVQESLKLMKQLFDNCVAKDWSGIAGTSGSVVGLREFASGKAAMAWGVNFGYSVLGDTGFTVGSMPFPTITKESTPVASGEPNRFGTGLGGTSYMIPAKTSGKNLEYAIKFLQFVSAPKHIQPWLEASGGIPAVKDIPLSPTVKGFFEGDWAKPMRISYGILQMPSTTTNSNAFGGYLLGTKSLAEQTKSLQKLYDERVAEDLRNHPAYADESWAK
ncbi:ABC transporter substrate-binding protein [Rhizohabitans arisaemae]|uniref:ABC transporter substrate-binding protein n=1 Tax=Rhizohabitans arisaemae TaxID=2720610 RepID=UPI0024B1DA04|nr:extracellular solute-binding protein [Rhizohabitans arisaemae]